MSNTPAPALLDLRAAGGVDPARLARSLHLSARRIGPGRYRVVGGREPHWVDLRTRRIPRCDCGDHLWRDRVCKHILAVLLREGDEHVIASIGQLVDALSAEARDWKRAARRPAARRPTSLAPRVSSAVS
jgi:hypothetical protein